MLRRGFMLVRADRVLVVEDVLTTGGSTRETMQVARAAGGQVVGAASIVDRSGGRPQFDVPFDALLDVALPTYEPDACPLCAQGLPVVKPGSRPVASRRAMPDIASRISTARRMTAPAVRRLAASGHRRPPFRGCSKTRCASSTDATSTVTGAGRTDAGVHALGQVASFTLDRDDRRADVLVRALNARLPAGVRVLSAEECRPTFHARFGARSKTYRYRIWNADVLSPFERSYAWHVPGPLDVDAMAGGRASARRAPRLRRVSGRRRHAAHDRARRVRVAPDRRGGRSGRSRRRSAGAADHYEVTGTASSATWCARSSARSSRSGAGGRRPSGCARCSRRAIDAAPARRRPPTACFSCASTTSCVRRRRRR